ncbi:MAG: KH domain-containing protein [Candidatus Sericytochromatia bacterium]|nr:KH domain-containing protein [Candidatus Sericytochromatia bacterium]
MADAEQDQDIDDGSDGQAEMAIGIETLQEFLRALGLPNVVTGCIEETQILLSVDSTEGGTLIGRKGQTLNALQHLINSVVRSAKFRVFVDIGDYRQRSIERLEEIAHRVAEQAMQGGRRVELKPMTAAERRIIHLTIQTYPELSTESIGEDPYRRIVIIPAGAPPLAQARPEAQPDHRGSMRSDARGPLRDRNAPRPAAEGAGQRIPRQGGDTRPRYPDSAPAARSDDRYQGAPRPPAPPGRGPVGPIAPGPRPGGHGPVAPGPRPGGPGGGVDRWGYTRDIPAEARAWMDDNQQVKPISGNPSWEAVEESNQPWVKDQPVFRPVANPWVDNDEVEYTEPGPADRW